MPIPDKVNVRSAIEALDQLAAFAQAFQDARTVFEALRKAESALSQIEEEIATKRAELEQLRNTEIAAVKAEAERQRESTLGAAREKAAEILNEARRERDVIRAKTSALKEKHDMLLRQIQNIQASVNQLTHQA